MISNFWLSLENLNEFLDQNPKLSFGDGLVPIEVDNLKYLLQVHPSAHLASHLFGEGVQAFGELEFGQFLVIVEVELEEDLVYNVICQPTHITDYDY